MKFLDSNIITYAFYENEWTQACQNAIREGGITNTFNLAEAFFIIEKKTTKENATKAIRSILKSNIEIVEIDVNIIFEALRRIKNTRLNIFDMIHYLTARQHQCSEILSYDKDFNNLDIPRQEPSSL